MSITIVAYALGGLAVTTAVLLATPQVIDFSAYMAACARRWFT